MASRRNTKSSSIFQPSPTEEDDKTPTILDDDEQQQIIEELRRDLKRDRQNNLTFIKGIALTCISVNIIFVICVWFNPKDFYDILLINSYGNDSLYVSPITPSILTLICSLSIAQILAIIGLKNLHTQKIRKQITTLLLIPTLTLPFYPHSIFEERVYTEPMCLYLLLHGLVVVGLMAGLYLEDLKVEKTIVELEGFRYKHKKV